MSQPNSLDDPMAAEAVEEPIEPAFIEPEPQYRKQGFSIYSMMLILSFLFLTAASIMFFSYAG